MNHENLESDFPVEIVREGNVKIIVPELRAFVKSSSDYAPSKAPVFYNPVMELNRDLAVLTLQAYQTVVDREISVCEPLAGCGAMGIRFAEEVQGVKSVVMADINEKAARLVHRNIQLNNLAERATVENADANLLLSSHGAPRRRFDAIDIDPFGSPVPYLDSAVRALRNNGLLALTATDMAPLCGVHSKACIRKYGGKPLRTEYCHELAVRLLAGCLATSAAKHNIGIDVVFSHCTNHYIRVYAIVQYGAKKADQSIGKMGYILHCFNCLHRETTKEIHSIEHSNCGECGSRTNYSGPLWLGPLSNRDFCQSMETENKKRMLKNNDKIDRILALIKDESKAAITYYVVDKLCDVFNLPVPSVKKIADTLRKEGFEVHLTHFDTTGIKTDAPAKRVKGILCESEGDRRQVLNNLDP